MLARLKLILHLVEKIEKLKLSLSKQHTKMLKSKFEIVEIKKNVKIIKLRKISRENLRKFSEISEKLFKNSRFPGS